MKIISFVNSKGGVGKTTLTINVGAALHELGRQVLLVDADSQGSIRSWQEAHKGEHSYLDVIAADKRQTLIDVKRTLNKLDHDYVLIDTQGKLSDMSGVAIAMSDLIIIPVCPSPYDLWASKDTINLILERQDISSDLKAHFVINRNIPSSVISRDVLEEIKKSRISMLGEPITQRVDFARCAQEGKTVFSTKNNDAINEIRNLTKVIVEALKDEE